MSTVRSDGSGTELAELLALVRAVAKDTEAMQAYLHRPTREVRGLRLRVAPNLYAAIVTSAPLSARDRHGAERLMGRAFGVPVDVISHAVRDGLWELVADDVSDPEAWRVVCSGIVDEP